VSGVERVAIARLGGSEVVGRDPRRPGSLESRRGRVRVRVDWVERRVEAVDPVRQRPPEQRLVVGQTVEEVDDDRHVAGHRLDVRLAFDALGEPLERDRSPRVGRDGVGRVADEFAVEDGPVGADPSVDGSNHVGKLGGHVLQPPGEQSDVVALDVYLDANPVVLVLTHRRPPLAASVTAVGSESAFSASMA
jgi:hypothetical protein